MTNFRLKTETGHSVQVIKAKTPLIDFFGGKIFLQSKKGVALHNFDKQKFLLYT